ncbi:MAG: DNA polymerase II large subunit [Candidatus Micrarchaeota archaeon]
MVECSPKLQNYFDLLNTEAEREYEVAGKARSKGIDPSDEVEIAPAPDVAARVEGLVGPEGVSVRIRELVLEKGRNAACFEIAKEIIEGKFGGGDKEKLIEQAVRTGLALFTEGVVSAPIEGVSQVKIKLNSDNSRYLAIYFAGPIRGAGGTGQAFTLLLGDYCRQVAGGIENYRPLEDEVERYKEEVNAYARRTRAGQYVPTDEEVEHVVRSCPVCIHGEPTEKYEVSVHKNLASIENNRVRGGMVLVLSEGVCLKAPKILKLAKSAGLNWAWLEKLIKVSKQESKKIEIKPVTRYMDEIVAGRPIFSYPLRPGGFRLRYGRTRYCGILAKAIHPASMILLDEFPVNGTQIKTERPGKGCIVTSCSDVEGPIVLLDDGEVACIETIEEALKVQNRVKEVLFLGDMVACYGDFLKSNHPLVPAGYCEEWMRAELAKNGVEKTTEELKKIAWSDALELTKNEKCALAPRFSFHWADLSHEQLKHLAEWIAKSGKIERDWFDAKGFKIAFDAQGKRILEVLGVPHKQKDEAIVFTDDYANALLYSLGLLKDGRLSSAAFDQAFSEDKTPLEIINEASGLKIEDKSGTFIGTSMGRPEKSRKREMKPPVNGLFPIGYHGGKMRDIAKAFKNLRNRGETSIEAELGNRYCPACNKKTWVNKCDSCGVQTLSVRQCNKCGKLTKEEKCSCGGFTNAFDKTSVQLVKEFERASAKTQFKPDQLKGVIGLISPTKTPELLDKAFLRAKHDLTVFRDGTCRHDSTEIPTTHFVPAEIGLSITQLRELGYDTDIKGKEVVNPQQTVELFPQDIMISRDAGEYLLRVSQFVDDLLVYVYGLPPYYKCEKPDDLIGKLTIILAPHTSAGIVSRIIGFTDVRGLIAHPYLHCATRRNCDGDEDCLILLMDGLLNFSRFYLPETRGGKMDAPLVLTMTLDPKEVDDEVHAMDIAWEYPLEFYEAAKRLSMPGEVKIPLVKDGLGKKQQYEGMGFTLESKLEGPTTTKYVLFKDMHQKVSDELALMKRIRAVDAANAAERIILSHFFPDLYGNLRSFSRQKFRCVDCNSKYRRVPLSGKCTRCGGKLLLTISKGGIEKYLKISQEMAEKYDLPNYLKQRLMLIKKEIASIFEDERVKQFSLSDYA